MPKHKVFGQRKNLNLCNLSKDKRDKIIIKKGCISLIFSKKLGF
jgi:hypothetical protein